MTNTHQFIIKERDRFLEELLALLRIPSVSADPRFKDDVSECANSISNHLISIGLDNVEICPTKGHPLVYGEKIVNNTWPTVLVYGHYDVQPADPLDLWHSPPFDPVIKQTEIHP